MEKLTIIGAGPAGALLAFLAGSRGYDVVVYDHSPYPGSKACGWAVPRQVERVFDLPSDAVIADINGYRVYVNGRLVREEYGKWGYIIDKPLLLKRLVSSYAELRKRHVRVIYDCSGAVSVSGVDDGYLVIAVGHSLYVQCGAGFRGDSMIYAVQRLFRVSDGVEDVIELHFDPSLVGYYWVFPRGPSVVDVGVGGFAEPKRLMGMLEFFVRRRFGVVEALSHVKGSWIYVGGARIDWLRREIPVIGEAAGFVYPLSGEGIRPSMASARAAMEVIEGGGLSSEVKRMAAWINIQKRILDKAVKASPSLRLKLLEKLPPSIFTGLGLGELRLRDLPRLAKYLPASILSMLKHGLKGFGSTER